MSLTVTLVASDGPLFVIASVNVRLFPAITGFGVPDSAIATSTNRLTLVVVVAALSLVIGSNSSALTVTVSVIVLPCGAVIVTWPVKVMTVETPEASGKTVQPKTPVVTEQPAEPDW